MKKYSQLLESLKPPIKPPKVQELKVGDKVEYHLTLDESIAAEVIAVGPNYVTLIKEGRTFKAWMKDVKLSNLEEPKTTPSQIYRESFIIKGYRTKNFTRKLSEQFKNLAATNSDIFAVYNTVVCLDNLLSMTKESLNESFGGYKNEYVRLNKYLNKFNIKLSEMATIEDIMLEHSINEGLRFSLADKNKIATIVAATAGVTPTSSATDTVNIAAKKFKTGSHTPEAWKIIGKILNKATQAGIDWDRDIFAKSTLKFMEIER